MFFFLKRSRKDPLTLGEMVFVLLLVLFSLAVFALSVWSYQKVGDARQKMRERPPAASPLE